MAANGSPEQHLDHLCDLSTIVFDPGNPLTDRLAAALERESQYLDLPYGFLTHIDQRAGQQDIVVATGTGGLIEEGETLPLSETYCRKTIETDTGQLTVEAASEEGWTDDPAFKRFGIESYVGSTVEFDEERRGTVCFTSEQPRQQPLEEFEVDTVALLARWAGYELAHRNGSAAVDPRPDRLATFLESTESSVVDRALDFLCDRTRRELLSYLATATGTTTIEGAAAYLANTSGVPGQSPGRIEIALVHSHIPKLADAGVVTYDERTGELDYRPDDAVERALRRVRPLEP